MKITGRNIKRRLYGLGRLPDNIKRARYWRGHGVHSPFVYSIVRDVFMCRKLKGENTDLYQQLISLGVSQRRAIELQNLLEHCRYSSFGIDCDVEQMEGKEFVIATLNCDTQTLQQMAARATELQTTLCILSPAYDQSRDKACKALVETHRCTSIDNRGYLLLFNNHLPKQKFRL